MSLERNGAELDNFTVCGKQIVSRQGSEIDQVVPANQGDVKFDWSSLRKRRILYGPTALYAHHISQFR